MSNNSAPAAPNYQPIADAQKASAEDSLALQKEQFAWAKQTYAENKGVTDQVVDSFLKTQQRNDDAAIKDRARYEQIYQPLEDSLAKDAEDYASPERKSIEMGRAEANVAQQFGAARVNAQRDLESFGINPGSTRFAALDIGVRAQQAAAQAGAGNQASQMVDATGRALRSEAINVGRGYPGQVAGTYNTALAAGTGANNAGLATTASGANTMGTGLQWNNAGNNSYNGAVNTMNTGFNNASTQFTNDQKASSGWGSALGLAAGIGMGAMGLPTSSVGGKLLGFADGGAIPDQVSPSRGKNVDDVNAKLSVGEFIVPKETVAFKGTEFFHKLIASSREKEAEMTQESGAIPSIHPAAMGAPMKRPPAMAVS